VIALNGKPKFNKAASQAATNQTILKSSVQMSAGHRPVVLEKDTDFHQNFVRHASVFDSKH
jgi:allophanate hydrolase subunit 2